MKRMCKRLLAAMLCMLLMTSAGAENLLSVTPTPSPTPGLAPTPMPLQPTPVPQTLKEAGILSVLPEGVAPIGGFLLAPRDFLKDADGLCYAREQIQQIINQLKLLLGE